MTSALIGHTGFVGGSLLRSMSFDALFNSSNFRDMAGCTFDRVVCAGVSAVKWLANREPEADRQRIEDLTSVLETVRAKRFTLISTVDVYPHPVGVDEEADCHSQPNHAYGTHRLAFETAIRRRFPDALVVRLPGLFGRGLKKNVIFDLLHDHALDAINPAGVFQWYDLARLRDDLDRAEEQGLRLVNLVTEPLATRDILNACFSGKTVGSAAAPAASYDVQTRHGALFGGSGRYIADRRSVLSAIAAFVDSERKRQAIP